MKLEEFKRLSKRQKAWFLAEYPRKDLRSTTCPFWVDRLITGLDANVLALDCDKDLKDIYNQIKGEYKEAKRLFNYKGDAYVYNIIDNIKKELDRAEKLHPEYPENIFEQLAIMQEEAGEVTKAVLDSKYKNDSISHIKEELIQTAAMCIRMIKNLKE